MKKTVINTLITLSFLLVSVIFLSCSNEGTGQDRQDDGYWLTSMSEQVTSMEEILKYLKDANPKAETPEQANDVALQKIVALEGRIKAIETWKDACNATYFTVADLGELEPVLGETITAAKEKAVTAAGKVMEKVYQAKMNAATVTPLLRDLPTDDPEIQSFIEFVKEYDQNILKIIEEAIENKGFISNLKSQELDQLSKDLEDKTQAIKALIDDLTNRIQSLSFIPQKTIKDEPFMGITLDGNDWYSWFNEDGSERYEYFVNTLKGPHRATLNYKVSPAYMAPKITADNSSFIVNRLIHPEITAKPDFKIEKIEAIQENGEYTGEIIIGVATDYIFTLDEKYDNWTSKKPVDVFSMAFQVNTNQSSNQDNADNGVVSDEISINWTNGSNAMGSVWLVEGTDSGWDTALKENYLHKMLYSDTEVREFYGNWAFMKVDRKDPSNYKYTPVNEVYPRLKVSLEPIDAEGNIVTDMNNSNIQPILESANADNKNAYIFSGKTVKIKDGSNTTALVGDKIVSNKMGVFISSI